VQDFNRKNRLCSHKGVFSVKRLSFARKCERTFGVGRRSRVGALEGTTKKKARFLLLIASGYAGLLQLCCIIFIIF